MAEVIKKNGTKEPFDSEKIRKSIAGAVQRTNLSEERKNEVVEQVAAAVIPMIEDREEVETSEIRETILSELDRVEPAVANAWREYEGTKTKD
ncbi:transcriptional regulator [bacterium (Candidatus Gribaldobacteria) CG_4_10_14_0_2_um_filter_36_18]|uniref:Transcriptional regulator n=1 Tax=bacterium (Candidatus Gribaldobacteria) CG_4_10_14_0_2_um_filter_36_18 TaxID=2014264 RepID=A0A2M7VLB4_9BACT|nr:MAG: transcriptional regulator [bacterium (Candidatus Gribaldobacteria) CG_4_10_14_0_2_um_filter_36_18]